MITGVNVQTAMLLFSSHREARGHSTYVARTIKQIPEGVLPLLNARIFIQSSQGVDDSKTDAPETDVNSAHSSRFELLTYGFGNRCSIQLS